MLNIRQAIIFLTILGMELSWLYALLNASNAAVSGRLSIPLLMLTLPVSLATSRALRLLRWPGAFSTASSWALWAIVMLLLVKVQLFPETALRDTAWLTAIPYAFSVIFTRFDPALLILLSTGVLWWLGRRQAYLNHDFPATVKEFQFGLIILVIFFFIAYQLKLDQSGSIPIALAFFSLALIGVSVSHAQDNNSWLSSWRESHWTGMLLISIALVLLLGMAISAIVTPDFLNLILKALAWIWGLIEKLLAWFASLYPQETPAEPPSPLPMPGLTGPDESPGFSLPEWLRPGLQLGWSILAAGLVLFAIWRIADQIFQWMRQRAYRGGGQVESLKGAFRMDLLDWLKRVLSRILGIKFGPKKTGTEQRIPPEIASVRQLYSHLLRWAADEGYPRRRAQTPEEYRYFLNTVIPENREELHFITREYMEARYGAVTPSEDKLNRLKQVWQDLRKVELKKKVPKSQPD